MSDLQTINFALSKEDFQDLMQMAERAISLRTSQTNVWCKLRGNLGTQYYEQFQEEKLDKNIAVLDHEIFPEGPKKMTEAERRDFTEDGLKQAWRIPIETENIKQLPSMQPNESSKL